MDKTTATSSTLTTPDSHILYTKTWTPSTPPTARLAFLHGFSDHCNWYDEFFRRLAVKGIKCYSFDQRGWGQSVHEPSQRGLSGSTEQIMTDITTFIRSTLDDEKDVPLFLGGHSMGGGEALTYLALGPPDIVKRFRGAVLEAPFLAQPPATRANGLVVLGGKMLSKVLPNRQMVQKLDKNLMCRDKEVCDAWERDELCHDTGTLEGLKGLLERGQHLIDGTTVVKEGIMEGGKTRIWCGHGTGDQVADFHAVDGWFRGLTIEDKCLQVYEGWYHKLHTEPGEDKVRFANDVSTWILDRSSADIDAKSKL